MANIEFISYDGRYPNPCSGKLVLKIDGEIVEFDNHALCSGGSVWFDEHWSEHVEEGNWIVDVPEKYKALKREITDCVNDNIGHGCCGGCV